MICLLYSYSTWPSRVSRNFFLLRSMSRDLNSRSSELICWLTADWVTPLIWAALVKLSVSAKSQNTFRLSICISRIKQQFHLFVNTQICRQDPPCFGQQFHAREGFSEKWRTRPFVHRGRVAAHAQDARGRRHLPDAVHQLPPAHARHDQVRNHQIHLHISVRQDRQGLLAAVGRQNFIAEF